MSAQIRLARREDAPAIAAVYGPYCTSTPISFEAAAPEAAEMAGRIERITECYPWLVLEDNGHVTGYAYACAHRERAAYRWSVDVAVYVDAARHRKGVGRALYSALFPVLAAQGYFKAYAGITLPNPASTGLHEALGFRLVGIYGGVGHKLGAWRDVGWFVRDLQQERPAPDEPLPLGEVMELAAWHDAMATGLTHYHGGD